MGYDKGGKYYGVGAPLFEAEYKETHETLQFRCVDYRHASYELQRLLEGKHIAD